MNLEFDDPTVQSKSNPILDVMLDLQDRLQSSDSDIAYIESILLSHIYWSVIQEWIDYNGWSIVLTNLRETSRESRTGVTVDIKLCS